MKILRLTMEDTDGEIKPIHIGMTLDGSYVNLPCVLKKLVYALLEEFDKRNNNDRHKDIEFKIIDNKINWKQRMEV